MTLLLTVCVCAIKKFKADLTDDVISDQGKLEKAFKKFCKKLPKGGKENRFVSYVDWVSAM